MCLKIVVIVEMLFATARNFPVRDEIEAAVNRGLSSPRELWRPNSPAASSDLSSSCSIISRKEPVLAARIA